MLLEFLCMKAEVGTNQEPAFRQKRTNNTAVHALPTYRLLYWQASHVGAVRELTANVQPDSHRNMTL